MEDVAAFGGAGGVKDEGEEGDLGWDRHAHFRADGVAVLHSGIEVPVADGLESEV